MKPRDFWPGWLARQSYSGWESFRVPLAGRARVRRHPATLPDASETFQAVWVRQAATRAPAPYLEPLRRGARSGWHVDRLVEDEAGRWRTSGKLDSADFGNASIYCALGAFGVEDLPDLSRIIKVCGPQKRDIPLTPPHYDLPGGHEYRAIGASRLLLYGCTWRAGDAHAGRAARASLFREFPVQRQRRVSGTAIVVTTVEREGMRITMIDFAPRGPDLCLACRVFVVENTGRAALDRLSIHHLAVNSRSSWTVSPAPHGCTLDDRVDGTGVRLFSPGFDAPTSGAPGPVDLFEDRPEASWQRVDRPLAFPPIERGGARSSWSVLVPRIAGGDPETEAAEAVLEGFDPAERIEATAGYWTGWSSRVAFRAGRPILSDLVDNLQVLLKTHEGERGFHLGATYQRHTHCWSRDNYLIQRGLLGGGRIEEAARNLEGFRACWRQSGIACGYNVFTRANWIPRPTAEICSYLVLMARDLELWTADPPSPGTWQMIAACADTLALNSRDLVGFDGDEIWFWELDPGLFTTADGRSLRDPETLAGFSVLDNCWLAIAALSYAERAARARGETAKAASWSDKRGRIERALERHLWDAERGVYTAFLFPDGRPYPGPLTNGWCTPSFFGVPETRPGSYRAMALACARTLATPEGVVKGNVDTAVYAGMTPGFHLHALGSCGEYGEGDRYFRDLVRSLPSSGGAWEYTVVDLPYTGTDKRRAGDSGVLLAAIMDYLVGFHPAWTGFTLRPHLPGFCRKFSVEGLMIRGRRLDVEVGRSGSRVSLDGRSMATVPAGETFTWVAEQAHADASSRTTNGDTSAGPDLTPP